MENDRVTLSGFIASRLNDERDVLAKMWSSSEPIQHFFVDDVLPQEVAGLLPDRFPDPRDLMLRSSLRERKRVGVELARHDPLVGETLYAFQEPKVVEAVARITGTGDLEGDPSFYASGISVMARDDFLNPTLISTTLTTATGRSTEH